MRNVSLLMALLLLGSLVGMGSALGATKARVVVGDATIALGDSFKIAVAVYDVANLFGYEFYLSYDPNVLEVVDVDPAQEGVQVDGGDIFAQVGVESRVHVPEPGRVVYYAATGPLDHGGAIGFSGSGRLAGITFRGIRTGSTALTLSQVLLSAGSGQPIANAVASGHVKVSLPATSVFANPHGPILLRIAEGAVSVIIPPLPSDTLVTLRQVQKTAVVLADLRNRLVGQPFELVVTQGEEALCELDEDVFLEVMLPIVAAIPDALGLYAYNPDYRTWLRVVGDLQAFPSAVVARTRQLGLFALIVDTHAPSALTAISISSQGQHTFFSGEAEPLATLQVFAGERYLGAFGVDLQGRYRFKVAIPLGTSQVSLRQLDQAGNTTVQYIDVSRAAERGISILIVPGQAQALVNNRVVMLDVAPRVRNGRAMVPLRFVAEALGAEVTWQAGTQTVEVVLGEIKVILTIGKRQAIVNEVAVMLDHPPVLELGRTMVPIRFVAEVLGYEVVWHAATNRIEIR